MAPSFAPRRQPDFAPEWKVQPLPERERVPVTRKIARSLNKADSSLRKALGRRGVKPQRVIGEV